MSGKFVRASSYRHVFGTAAKKENQFVDVRPDCTGLGPHITANHKFFAISLQGGGGPVAITSLDAPGRQNRNPPKLAVHKGKVLAAEFNPFVSNMIGTASEDCYAKVTQFDAAGLKDNVSEATVTLEGHQKKVTEIHFHPTANNVAATASADNTVKVWDIEKQAEVFSYDTADNPFNFQFNSNGSLIGVTSKDKKLTIYDPRQAGAAQSVDIFDGSKQSSVSFLDNHGKVATVGFTRNSMRQYKVWDPKKLDKALNTTDIDQSAGVLLQYYDPDNSILYIGGKGDGGVKYFEVVDQDPYIHFLSEFRTNQSQKGLAFVPKRGLDTKKCEVALALRLMRDSVVPVSFCVPRKSDIFQKDIYPDTYAGTSTNTADDYVGGKDTDPATISMNPKDRGEEQEAAAFVAKKSPAELQKELDAALARIKELEAQLAAK